MYFGSRVLLVTVQRADYQVGLKLWADGHVMDGQLALSFGSGAEVGTGSRVVWVEGFPADHEGCKCVVFPSSHCCGGPLSLARGETLLAPLDCNGTKEVVPGTWVSGGCLTDRI